MRLTGIWVAVCCAFCVIKTSFLGDMKSETNGPTYVMIYYNEDMKLGMTITLILFYMVLTFGRNLVWLDEYSLWRDALAYSPEKIRPHVYLGNEFLRRGLFSEAIQEYEFVKKKDALNFSSRVNLGGAYLLERQWDDAI